MILLSKEIKYNIASINLCTEVEGPHKRVAIWFQGCKFNCSGCCNKDYQHFTSKNIMTLEQLIEVIVQSKEENEIEGVTLLGGEPTLQDIHHIGIELKKLNIGTILFTGNTYSNLSEENKTSFDLIVDGLFNPKLLDTKRNMIGSTNQNIIDVTNRYPLSWFTDKREKRVEININELLNINGDVVI